MEITLIVVAALGLVVLGVAAFSIFNDPENIDKEEERDVRAETPAQHERAQFQDQVSDKESNETDIDMYSTGQ